MKRTVVSALVVSVGLLAIFVGCSGDKAPVTPERLCSDQEIVDVDEIPELLHFAGVEYPSVARDSLWEGVAFVAAWVEVDSTVCDASISTSSGYEVLDNAAIDAIMQSLFIPATKDGEAVLSPVVIGVGFRLSEENAVLSRGSYSSKSSGQVSNTYEDSPCQEGVPIHFRYFVTVLTTTT